MSSRAHHRTEPFKPTSELLGGLEGKRVITLNETARLNGTSVDTIKRHYGHLIVRVSNGRIGMRLEDALSMDAA